ncbi:LOW QUALITY PROTEIN: ankyrin repeat and zinc finger domain-containing protein 1-like [Pecten maximus]|uniref:LOW QUALITY PROTEIN: ankyrin repeat and zinc finger domain-containing protein 1-like n=1 Tax=Pecten maximus TaxID=6579 RepID=UPI001457F979|nr:LOW QUALITY PROTEIN: ankyrin repeat and zinc finger domain-containing protein 1-like [Pecten maximus]
MASTSTLTPPGTPKKIQKRPSKQYSTCLLYNTGQALAKLTDLTLAACNPTRESQETTKEHDDNEQENVVHQRADYTSVSEKMSCNYCTTDFTSREDQISHYKSDWHRYNLRLRLKDKDSITEAKFIEISACVSSISGSESESDDSDVEDGEKRKLRSKPSGIAAYLRNRGDSCSSSNDSETELPSAVDDAARKFPKLFFRNKDGELISIYRCILYHKKNQPATLNNLATMATNAPHHMTWAIFMAAGGHFAAAIFDKNEILVHKTFHRYVVRAKRGTAQSSRDSQGNAPKSAGASLRRYNEAALKEEVHELFSSWSELLAKCDLIFLRAPSFNKRIFFSGKTPPLQKKDERIRMIPFATRRPTHNEVRRVHEVLCSVECYGAESEIRDFIPLSPAVTFSADTGHLEIVPDDPQTSPKHRKIKDKSKLKTSPLANTDSKTSERPDSAEDKLTKPMFKCQQLELLDALHHDTQALSSGASTASDTDLVDSMETLSTEDLKEFKATRKPRPQRPRARKRRPSLKRQIAPESDALEEEKYHLKNSLYTACKVGDFETLQNLLAVFASEMAPTESIPRTSIEPCGEFKTDTVSSSNGSQDNYEIPVKDKSETKRTLKSNDVITGVSISERECKTDMEKDNLENTLSESEISDPNKNQKEKERMNLDISNKTCNELQGFGSNSNAEEILSPMVSIAILNEPIGDQLTTLLHVAAKEGHKKVIKALLESGADPAIKDKFGKTPYTSTSNKETRNEFRRFMAKFPLKYDYEAAQVPSPLTEEMETERRQKEAERKKIQKKAKQEKMKEKHAEEEVMKKEEREKVRFLSLSDREKRALAAEKRLVKQTVAEGVTTPVLSRCFQCGRDMTGKVPFEYCDYKFCTTKCLKEHRLSNTKT